MNLTNLQMLALFFTFEIVIQSVPKTCIHTLTANSSVDVSFFLGRLSFEQRKLNLLDFFFYDDT